MHAPICAGAGNGGSVSSATVDPTGCHLTVNQSWGWSDPSPGFCEGQYECFIVDFSIMGDAGQGTVRNGYSSTCDPHAAPGTLTATRLPPGTVIGPCVAQTQAGFVTKPRMRPGL